MHINIEKLLFIYSEVLNLFNYHINIVFLSKKIILILLLNVGTKYLERR